MMSNVDAWVFNVQPVLLGVKALSVSSEAENAALLFAQAPRGRQGSSTISAEPQQ